MTKRLSYFDYEASYPNHCIVSLEGYFYTAHNKSAEILSDVLGYRIYRDYRGRVSAGTPNLKKVRFWLENVNQPYIILEHGEIVHCFDGRPVPVQYDYRDYRRAKEEAAREFEERRNAYLPSAAAPCFSCRDCSKAESTACPQIGETCKLFELVEMYVFFYDDFYGNYKRRVLADNTLSVEKILV